MNILTQSIYPEMWSCDANLITDPSSSNPEDSGGLTLANVRHDHFSLARDIRIVAIWVGSGLSPDKRMMLGGKDLPAYTGIVHDPPQTVQLFADYPRAYELSTVFQTPGSVLGSGNDSQPLTLTQRYILTKESLKPYHEPLGVLTAARLYPIVQFSYKGLKDEKKPLNYLRIDYRFEFRLDPQIGERHTGPDLQQSSVVLDPDDLASGFKGHVKAITSPITATGTPPIEQAFDRAEKPLETEMIGKGLNYNPISGRAEKGDWDNVHVWGKTKSLPRIPGVTHGAHIHWRWGKVSFSAAPWYAPLHPVLRDIEQFKGSGGPGGPLIDNSIPGQSLKFAITENASGLEANKNPSSKKFEGLFTSSSPNKIHDGVETLIVWISIEIFRGRDFEEGKEWAGVVFPNGIYFAHYPDPYWGPIGWFGGGFQDEIHKPGTQSGTNYWYRP